MRTKTAVAAMCGCAAFVAAPVGMSAQARGSRIASGVSGLDQQYLTTSMQGDLFEIDGGRLALTRTHNRYVRTLAKTLVSDHTKSFDDTAKLARTLGVTVPNSPTGSQKWELQMVAALNTQRAFNHWYSSLEVDDHVQDISDATTELTDGSNKAVRDDARTELPMLHKHLRLAKRALAHSR